MSFASRGPLELLCVLGLLSPVFVGGCGKDDNGVVEVSKGDDKEGNEKKPRASRGNDDDDRGDDAGSGDDKGDKGDKGDTDDDDTADDDEPRGDDDEPASDDGKPTGDDDEPSGDDDVSSGDDDAPSGDDDVSASDDDPPAGDDDAPSGDDDAPQGGTGPIGQGGASGGAPVTPSGSAGAGGSAPQPVSCGPGVVDDFSTCDKYICTNEGRTGTWFSFSGDGIGLDEELNGVRYPTSDWSDPSCAMMLAGGDNTVDVEYFAGIGLALNAGDPYDLSPYRGARFTVETGSQLDFTIRTAADEYFVYSTPLGPSTGAQTFTVDFASMVARSDNPGATLNLAYAKEFQWTVVEPELGFGLALHSVTLY